MDKIEKVLEKLTTAHKALLTHSVLGFRSENGDFVITRMQATPFFYGECRSALTGHVSSFTGGSSWFAAHAAHQWWLELKPERVRGRNGMLVYEGAGSKIGNTVHLIEGRDAPKNNLAQHFHLHVAIRASQSRAAWQLWRSGRDTYKGEFHHESGEKQIVSGLDADRAGVLAWRWWQEGLK